MVERCRRYRQDKLGHADRWTDGRTDGGGEGIKKKWGEWEIGTAGRQLITEGMMTELVRGKE